MSITKQLEQERAALRTFDDNLQIKLEAGTPVEALATERSSILNRLQTLDAIERETHALEVAQRNASEFAARKKALNTLHDVQKDARALLKKHERTVATLKQTALELEELRQKAQLAINQAQAGDMRLVRQPIEGELALVEKFTKAHDNHAKLMSERWNNKFDVRKALD